MDYNIQKTLKVNEAIQDAYSERNLQFFTKKCLKNIQKPKNTSTVPGQFCELGHPLTTTPKQ